MTTDATSPTVVRSGVFTTSPDRDFTVKVDVGPRAGPTYSTASSRRQTSVDRPHKERCRRAVAGRLAVVSCANFQGGFFNVYAALAARTDLDAILHLGDYIYEFRAAVCTATAPHSAACQSRCHEAITLSDYRRRYAHTGAIPISRQSTACTRSSRSGTITNSRTTPGRAARWVTTRRAKATGAPGAPRPRAYREWMPVRENPGDLFRLYRSFARAARHDLVMLDTRSAQERAGVSPRMSPGSHRRAAA